MSKKANKTLIGAFVTGAIALVVIAILIFGSGKFLRKTYTAVMFFDSSVKGLNVGAPVMFKGVKVGSVVNMYLLYSPSDSSLRIPVFVELEPERITWATGAPRQRNPERGMKLLIERGLRAQLQMQSFITGQLVIALDFLPEKPVKLTGIIKKYQEIPTVPTSFEELTKSIEELPIKKLFARIDHIAEGIDKMVNSPDIKKSVKSLSLTLRDARKLVKHMDDQVDPRTSIVLKTVESLNELVIKTKMTLDTFSEDSRLVYESNRMLKELNAAARSMQILADYLERHPESLVSGKKRE